jgi:exopolysaccharide production protein ExoQ
MRISLKFLGDAFTILVLFLGTGAFISLLMDKSNPDLVTDGSWLTQVGWTLIYIMVLVRAAPLRREIWRTAKANKPLLFLVLLALVSSLWSADAGLSIRRGFAVLATTLFGLDFAVRYSIRDQVRLFGTALALAIAASVIVELFFHGMVPTVDTAYTDAWNGAFVQKNDFARIVVLGGVLTLMRVRNVVHAAGAVAASVVLIVLCHSKTALAVFVAMLVLLRVFRLRRRGPKALVAGIVGVLIVSALVSVVIDLDSTAEMLGRDATLTGRTNIWAMAIESAVEKPILGYGYNAFWNVAPEADRISTILHWKVPHAHNGFIDLTLQLGLVGLGLFLWTYAIAVRRAIAFAYIEPEKEAMWPLAYLAFALLYQVTESTIFVGNTIVWMVYVSTICTVTRAADARLSDHFSEPIPEEDALLEPQPSFAGSKGYV